MENVILFAHVIISIALIGFILIQQGKGSEVGASFGSSASQTVFGSQGSGSFLTRMTAILVTLFFISNLAMGYLANKQNQLRDLDEVVENIESTTSIQSNQDIPKIPLESSPKKSIDN